MSTQEKQLYRRHYVWEWPVRVWHWSHFVAMVLLCVTGYFIGNPFMVPSANPFDPALTSQALGVMAANRLVHFVSAIVLSMCVLLRLYWFVAGDRYSRFSTWFPFLGRAQAINSLQLIRQQLRYYLFLRRDPPHGAGHNPMAAIAYGLMLLALIVETVTGWALYGLSSPTGVFWKLGGWLFSILSNQTVRSVHHVTMYALAIFFFVHLYLAIRDDNLSELGTMSSMFSGHKFWPADDGDD